MGRPPKSKLKKSILVASTRAPWADSEKRKAAWNVGERLTPSEWAKLNRVLGEKDSSEPGNWNNDRTPYLVGIMDAMGDPEITTVDVMKAAQVGLSEVMRNVLGYWIDQDPGPVLMVMPDEESAKELLGEKVQPLIRQTPALAAHMTKKGTDLGKLRILLDNIEIHAAWASSPQKLASRPKRYVIYDEIDKYPAFSGKESDPISLGDKRRTTYGHRSKSAAFSTPTTRQGAMWRRWEKAPVKLHFHVPCPACGVFAPIAWANIRWPDNLEGTRAEQAAQIQADSLAWCQCPCGLVIRERQRASIVRKGRWAPEGWKVTPDGPMIQGRPRGVRHVAFHVPALISPWVTWSQMAAEFVAAIGDESTMMDWRNSRLGWPYEIRASAIKSDTFSTKIKAGHKHGLVPAWAGMLLATADTQKDGFWYTLRAWGWGFRSRLIDSGFVSTFDELRERCLSSRYPIEGTDVEPMGAHMLFIDSGGGSESVDSDLNLTNQVYQFALSDPARIYAIKGYGGTRELEVPVRQSFVAYSSPGAAAPAKVALYLLKTGYFKDVLSARVVNDAAAGDSWELHEQVDKDYCKQMASEHKVIIRKGRHQVARWVLVTPGAANHLWDAEVYQQAAAQIAHVELIPPPADLLAERQRMALPQDRERSEAWDSAVSGW